ncbi:hypothetical protein AAF712_000934 [Marasmius tenuissimus]|uniref:Uncharacterized protein n=1 Tax=Marasmius tenuissimus TaxID=585030 RepID=A0ABR3ADN7_9AGAR|nr:hypothetical protein PM082_002820 [Marasmius tenuissimus]
MASPLDPTTVSVLLQYILPPSQLTEPLPKHLISTNLYKRHFFLGLTDPSTDPSSYLSWPSPDQKQIFDLLETFTAPLEELPSNLDIRYTGDADSTFAHVAISSNDRNSGLGSIRLVFEWDAEDSAWRYHNVALMPFPPHSFEAPEAISAPAIQVDHAHEPAADDDSYWDSYGNEGATRSPGFLSHSNGESSEDAYWAQYASVHGTADSTRPTPPPERQRHTEHDHHDDANLHELNDFYGRDKATQESHPVSEEVIQIPYQSFNVKRPYDRNSPPCPDDLTERLRAIQSDGGHPHTNGTNGTSSPHHLPTNGDLASPNGLDMSISGKPALTNGLTNGNHSTGSLSDETETASGADGSDDALREAIRGTYALWKLSQKRNGALPGKEQQELFLDAVKGAIVDC